MANKLVLSDAWKHATSDAIPDGVTGFGKIRRGSPMWAHATTHFRRPDNVIVPKQAAKEISSVNALREAAERMANAAPKAHNSDEVCIPFAEQSKGEVADAIRKCAKAAEEAESRFNAANRIDYALYALTHGGGGKIREFA